jgi:hypothetical protein
MRWQTRRERRGERSGIIDGIIGAEVADRGGLEALSSGNAAGFLRQLGSNVLSPPRTSNP